MRIIYSRDDQRFPARIKLLSSQIKINAMFKSINGRKRGICDKNIHKAMQISVDIYQSYTTLFVAVK